MLSGGVRFAVRCHGQWEVVEIGMPDMMCMVGDEVQFGWAFKDPPQIAP